ncbi:MAG: DMT family transporter [Simkaniaceae bacterium]
MWLVFFMYAMFASVFTVGKVALHYSDPYFLTGVRMLIAGIILLAYQILRNPALVKIQKKHLLLLFLVAFFNVFTTNAFEFWALKYMQTGKTSLIYSLQPFASIIFSYFMLKETMSFRKWTGLFIGLIGFVPIFLTHGSGEEGLKAFAFITFPEIAVSVSAFTSVFGWIFMKQLTQKYHFPLVTANAYSFILGAVFCFIVSFALEPWRPFPVSSFYPFLWTVLYIAIIHNVVCYNIYAYSLKKFSVTFMTFAGFTNPMFTALYGVVFLGEKLTVNFIISLFAIILGLYIYSLDERKKNKNAL